MTRSPLNVCVSQYPTYEGSLKICPASWRLICVVDAQEITQIRQLFNKFVLLTPEIEDRFQIVPQRRSGV